MATRLYFRNITHSLSGTLPSTEQSSATANWTATGATTLKTLSDTAGSSQTSHSGSSQATTATQSGLLGRFVSKPLAGAQTVGGGSMILNAAESESNTASNFWVNAVHVYVWRPSSGTLVGTVRDAGATSLGGSEPTAASSVQVSHITGITSSAVSAQSGDVVIVEVWARFTQSMGTSYTDIFYFDGATTNTTENAQVSNHASFIELAENLVFIKDVDLAGTLTAAVSASSPITYDPLSIELVGTTQAASVITLPDTITPGDVVLAMAFRDGSTTPPTLPSGWTEVATATGTACSALLASLDITLGMVPDVALVDTGFSLAVYSVEYLGGKYLAGGNSARLIYSDDAITWTVKTNIMSGVPGLHAIAYGNGVYLFTGGANGKICTSTDLNTFTEQTTPFTQNTWAAAYGDGVFVVAGQVGEMYYSSNGGVSWTACTASLGSFTANGMAFNGSRFVLAASAGSSNAYSDDGITWTAISGVSDAFQDVEWGNGLFVATTNVSGRIYTSDDGITWTQRNSGVTGMGAMTGPKVAYTGTKWVLCSANTTDFTEKYAETVDPTGAWAYVTVAGSEPFTRIGGHNNVVVLAQATSDDIYTSTAAAEVEFANATAVVANAYRGLDPTDEIGVSASTSGTGTTVTLPAVSNAASSFVAGFVGHSSADVAFNDVFVAASAGKSWAVGPDFIVNSLATNGSELMAVTNVNVKKMSRNFTNLPTTNITAFGSLTGVTCTAGGTWVVVGSTGGIVTSPDGLTWTTRTSGTSSNLRSVAHDQGSNVVAVGESGALTYSTDSGVTWTATTVGSDTLREVVCCAASGVWITINNSRKIYRSTNGNSWSDVTAQTPGGTGFLNCVANNGGAKWLVGGANGALWRSTDDGANWSALTSPFVSGRAIAGLAYGDGVWVATTENANNDMAYSTDDGSTWTFATIAGTAQLYRNVFFQLGFFLANGLSAVARVSYPTSALRQRAAIANATNEAASYDSGGAVP